MPFFEYIFGKQLKEERPEGWVTLPETAPPTTQFYNVRGWEVVDECDVLAETSQKEAIRSKMAVAAGVTKTKEFVDIRQDPLADAAVIDHKRWSTNCRRPSSKQLHIRQPASVVLDRLAPRIVTQQQRNKKQETVDRHFDPSNTSSPSPTATHTALSSPPPTKPPFSYAAKAKTAVAKEAAKEAAAANEAAEEEAKLLKKEKAAQASANQAMHKSKKKKVTPPLLETLWPAPVSLAKQSRPAVRSWAQICA